MTAHVWPGAVYRPIPAATRQPRITPRAIILHSAAGKGSLYQWWLTNPRGLESHLWIAENGTTEQYVPFNIRADANGAANSFAISIETESTKYATEPWTQAQVDRLIAVLDWVCRTYSIPRRLMTHPTDSGIAWHVQFGAPGPWTGVAKVCPGPARIAQVKSVIVPRLQALTGAKPAPSPSKPAPTPTGGLTMSEAKRLDKRIDTMRNATLLLIEAANRRIDTLRNATKLIVTAEGQERTKAIAALETELDALTAELDTLRNA